MLEADTGVLVAGQEAVTRDERGLETLGIPATPSRALTAPSCIAPEPDSDMSSSCSAMNAAGQALVLQRATHDAGVGDRAADVGEPERADVRSSAISVRSGRPSRA